MQSTEESVVVKRRDFVLAAGSAAAATAASSLPAPAVAQDRIRWTMVSSWPKNSPGVGVNAQRVADRINEMADGRLVVRSEEHTSELQSLMRISYAVFCLKKNNKNPDNSKQEQHT